MIIFHRRKPNQIFTPKTMVKKMVDMLEQENPGCFDMPDKTFIDFVYEIWSVYYRNCEAAVPER